METSCINLVQVISMPLFPLSLIPILYVSLLVVLQSLFCFVLQQSTMHRICSRRVVRTDWMFFFFVFFLGVGWGGGIAQWIWEMFLPDCIYIWWWKHFIYGFCYMGHPDYFRGSLVASKLTDLSGPSADIKATPCITRQCCDLKVNMTGL